MSLLEQITEAEKVSELTRGCPMCIYIREQEGEIREALTRAAAGTIGITKLAEILRAHDTGIGNRTIARHREEEHTP